MGSRAEDIKIVFKVDGKDVGIQIDDINKGLGKMSGKADNVSSSFKKMAAAALSFAAIKSGFDSAISSAVELETITKKLNIATGDAASSFADITKIAGKYGLELSSTADAFGSFAVATKGTALEGKQTLKVFDDVSSAIAGLGLNTDSSTRIFKALEQMMSKGKVSAEELRGQMGDAGLAGAFEIAARSANMTTSEFDKLMSSGKVMSVDFIPKFAEQIKKELGQNASNAVNTIQGSLANLDTEVFTLSSTIGKEFTPAIVGFAKSIKGSSAVVSSTIKDLKTFSSVASAMAVPIGGVTNALILATASLVAYNNFAKIVVGTNAILSASMVAITTIRFAAVTGSFGALAVAAGTVALPFIAVTAAIAATGFALNSLFDDIKRNEAADKILADSLDKNVKLNKKAAETYTKIRERLISFTGSVEEADKMISNILGKSKDVVVRANSQVEDIRKLNKGLREALNMQFDKSASNISSFNDRLAEAGINLDKIIKERDFKALDNAIAKVKFFNKQLLAEGSSFSTKYSNSIKTKIQRESEAFNAIRKKFIDANLQDTEQFKKIEATHTEFVKVEVGKRAESERAKNEKIMAMERSRIFEIHSLDKNIKSKLLSETKKFELEKARVKLNAETRNISKKQINRQVVSVEDFSAQENALKSFNKKRRAIELDDFTKRQSLEEADFLARLDKLNLREDEKNNFIIEKTKSFNETQAIQREEFNIKLEEDRANERVKLEEFEKSKLDVITNFKEQGRTLFDDFASIQNDITAVNFGNLIKKTKNFTDFSAKLWKTSEEGKLAVTQTALGGLSKLMESHNRKAFEAGKAAAIANATISTFQGATQALSLGPILGPIMAGVITALGFANISKIASTPFKGGGGGKPSSGSASIPSVQSPTPPTQQSQGGQSVNNSAAVNLTIQALDPSAIDETTMQQIGDKLAPVLQNSFNRNQNFSVI